MFSPAGAQRLPVEPGNWVRVAALDSAMLNRWREGRVVAATRLGVLLSGRSFGADTVPIPGTFDVHETDGPGPAWDATLENGMLRIRFGTPLTEWVRLPPAPAR